MNQDVVMSPFARSRHVPESQFSHFAGSEEDLVRRIRAHMLPCYTLPGYRDGVIRILVPPEGFFTSVVELKDGDQGTWQYCRRKENEELRIQMFVDGVPKRPAKRVEVILYRHDVLAENNEHSCDAEWEVVTINASPYEVEEPMHPGVLMANHFGVSGGTDTKMTDEEFVAKLREGYMYWRNKMVSRPGG